MPANAAKDRAAIAKKVETRFMFRFLVNGLVPHSQERRRVPWKRFVVDSLRESHRSAQGFFDLIKQSGVAVGEDAAPRSSGGVIRNRAQGARIVGVGDPYFAIPFRAHLADLAKVVGYFPRRFFLRNHEATSNHAVG